MRFALLLAVAAALLAAGEPPAPKGHAGPPTDGALRIEVLPADGSPTTFAGPGPLSGNPFIYVHDWMKNTSDAPVKVRACSAEAEDAAGLPLFTIVAPFHRPLLRPGEEMGLRPGDPRGTSTSGWVAPDGITRTDLDRVARYAVTCEVRAWIGPLPQPYEHG